MTIRQTMALLALTLLMAVAAFAQPQRMTPQERTERLTRELSLTEQQKAKVLDLFTLQEQSMPATPAGDNGDGNNVQKMMEGKHKEMIHRMKEILTKGQYAKFETLEEGKHPEGRPPQNKGQNPHGGYKRMTPQQRTDQMARDLGLTDEQKSKVLDFYQQEERSIQMPPPSGKVDKNEMRAKMDGMRRESEAKLKAILSPAQFEKYQKLNMPGPRGKTKEMERKEKNED